MTLNLTLANQHGIWQSADLRLSDNEGKATTDYSVKQVQLRCSDGSVVIAYGGHGRFEYANPRKEIDLSDWIRQFIRGEPYTVGQALRLIQQRATDDIGEALVKGRIRQLFSIGAVGFEGGAPWIGNIRNFTMTAPSMAEPVHRHFVLDVIQVPPGRGIVLCWPPWREPLHRDLKLLHALLQKACNRQPRDPNEFAKLLGSINLRASKRLSTVSPHCISTYLSSSAAFHSQFHNFPKDAPKVCVPFILLGVDNTDLMRAMKATFRQGWGNLKTPFLTPQQYAPLKPANAMEGSRGERR
jgi:hypothetical protein